MLDLLDDIHDLPDRTFDAIRQRLLDDLLYFFQYAFWKMKGKWPEIPQPIGRVNHFQQLADKFSSALRGEVTEVNINIPSRYGKTLMACSATAWCYAHQPAANFIYGSHGKSLAAEQTEYVREIIQSHFFQVFFDARISKSTWAKHNFKTIQGGHTIAVGADGTGIGRGAGLKGDEPFGGAIMLDDMLKSEEAFSPAARERIRRIFSQVFVNRRNNPEWTPIIHISQRLDQQDLSGQLLDGVNKKPIDVYQKQWRENALIIPALDDAENALWPSMHSKKYLLDLKKVDEYTFYAIFQQCPISPGNRIFKIEHIKCLKEEPNIVATFITADTAETVDDVNSATVFSLWGIYEIEFNGQKSGMLGLHSLSCREIWVAPEDLDDEFEYFYSVCLRHHVKPTLAFIEKKSTGVTLLSRMKNKPGLAVVDIERTGKSGNKTARFVKTAVFVAKGQVSINRSAYHYEKFLEHLGQITLSGSQAHDDIADTLSDAIQIALIDKSIYNNVDDTPNSQAVDKILLANKRRRFSCSQYSNGM